MPIKHIVVLNGGKENDFRFSLGQDGVKKITEYFHSNGAFYYSVTYDSGNIIDIHSSNVIVFREVS